MSRRYLAELMGSALVSASACVIAYFIGLKNNKRLSKAQEDKACYAGELMGYVKAVEDMYQVAKKHQNTDDVEGWNDLFQKGQKSLEQNGLWEKYRLLYPEEDE